MGCAGAASFLKQHKYVWHTITCPQTTQQHNVLLLRRTQLSKSLLMDMGMHLTVPQL